MSNHNIIVGADGLRLPKGVRGRNFDVEVYQDGGRHPETIVGVRGECIPEAVEQYDGVIRVVLHSLSTRER